MSEVHRVSENIKRKIADASRNGFSLVELMVAVLILAVIFGATLRFAMNSISAREMVRRDIELEGVRWYLRDSLSCEQTFSVKKSTKLPLSCADFPRGKDLVLRSKPFGDSSTGANLGDVFSNTVWKLRGYCDNNRLIVEYAPRFPKPVDRMRGLIDVTPSDVALPRSIRPPEISDSVKLPDTLGFPYLGAQLQGEKPIECPPTNSWGTLIALGRFAASTFLNSMPVKNDPLKASDRWAAAMNTSAMQSLPASASALGSAAQNAVQQTRSWAGMLMKNVAEEALKRSVRGAVATAAQGALSGNGVDMRQISGAFTKGAIDGAAGAFGLPPLGTNVANAVQSGNWGVNTLFSGGDEVDSNLTLAVKIPLQMGIVLTNAGQDMNACIQRAMTVLGTGVAQAIPQTRVEGFFAKDLNNCMRNDLVERFDKSVENLVGNVVRGAFRSQYDSIKPAVNAKFNKIESDIRASESNPVLLAKALGALADVRNNTMAQIDAQSVVTNQVVDGMMNDIKTDFRQQINAITLDPSLGTTQMLAKLRQDLTQIQNRIRASGAELLNRVKNSKVTNPKDSKNGIPVNADPPWMDIFAGASKLCGNIFAQIPERDYQETENSCPLLANGAYPVFAGRKGETPVCCREVASKGGEQMRCDAGEYSLLGGAECSGPGQSLLGDRVMRSEVLPAFQGMGFGLGYPFSLGLSNGGMIGSPPSAPVPHQHVVNGRAPVLVPPIGPTAITVSKVYTSTQMILGGFIRASGPEYAQDGRLSGRNAMCVYANKRGSRHDDWTGPQAAHRVQTRGLCCPLLGLGGR